MFCLNGWVVGIYLAWLGKFANYTLLTSNALVMGKPFYLLLNRDKQTKPSHSNFFSSLAILEKYHPSL
jgi:hypothetical protein